MDAELYNDTIRGVVAIWERRNAMTQGGRNHNTLKLAYALNEYGIRQTDALQVCLRYEDMGGNDPFTAKEITQVVRSAYTKQEKHGTKTWVPRGQYRRPGPRLPSPWTLPGHVRAAIVAKLMEEEEQGDAEVVARVRDALRNYPEDEAQPQVAVPSPARTAPLPPPPPPAALHPPSVPAAILVCDMVRQAPHLQPYTLALELYVRTGVEWSGQQVARLLADTTKNSEGGNAPNAYPVSTHHDRA